MIMAAMALYPMTAFGGAGRSGIAIVMSAVAAYGLAIILYFGIPTLVFLNQWMIVRLGGIAALLLGIQIAGEGETVQSVLGWGMVWIVGIVCGWMTQSHKRPIHIYVTGLTIIVVLALIAFGSQWQETMNGMAQAGKAYIEDAGTTMSVGGSAPATVARYTERLQVVVDFLVRILPASTILNSVLQFTVGYLWFSGVTVRSVHGVSRIRPFTEWRSPFALAVPLVAALSARLLGGESAKLIADNALVILALFYAVTGLALIEHTLRRMGLPRGMKIGAYLLMFLLQIPGFLITALLGFIDSFVDWRGRAEAKNAIDN